MNPNDILTRITRYNLIRDQRLIYIDVHEAVQGKLAARFVSVPNLINIIAKQEYQGVGETESEALETCLTSSTTTSEKWMASRSPCSTRTRRSPCGGA